MKAFRIKAQDKANFGSSSSRNAEAAAAHLRSQANVAISMAAQNLCSLLFRAQHRRVATTRGQAIVVSSSRRLSVLRLLKRSPWCT